MNQNRNQLFKMATISMHRVLSLCGHSSIELRNTSIGKSAAAFRRDRFKLSILGCLFLQQLFHGQNWSFQDDPAPVHKTWRTQQWLETNVTDLNSDWPSASPDLNPLDYKMWSNLLEKFRKQRHPNIERLKQSLQKASADFPVYVLHISIDE